MATYKKCTNGHIYDTSIYGEICPFCPKTTVCYATQSDLQFRCPGCGVEFTSRDIERLVCPICGQRIIDHNSLRVGREDCDIMVNSLFVSRCHACIRYVNRENDYFLYYDNSLNGTTIDGLHSKKGDIIKIPNHDEHTILLAGEIKLDWDIVKKAFSKCPDYYEAHKECCCKQMPSSNINLDRHNPNYSYSSPSLSLPKSDEAICYSPKTINSKWLSLLHFFGVKKGVNVYSSVFAPAEIAPKQHLMVQVYLHLPEETETVKSLASEADKNAERRGYEPLEVPLKKGDNVEIELNVNGDSLLFNCRKSVVWQGSFVKRAFDFVVPADIDVYELSSSVNIYVNGAIAGELVFLTSIVDSPRQLNTNVYARPTKKIFISYSHKDIKSAEKIAKIHEALGIDVFFDKHRLKAGYIFSEEISKFIHNADTFVLCWSENAAQSEYVKKERQEALALAYPQFKPREAARLRIHPYNIEPHAVPPADMIEHYHFEQL